MTNVKSKGATKELAVEAQKVLGDATRVRKGADSLVQSLKKLENRFQREKEEAAAQLRREEQQKAIASHSKAFTMLDDEDKAQIAAAEAAEKAAKEAAAKAAAENDGNIGCRAADAIADIVGAGFIICKGCFIGHDASP